MRITVFEQSSLAVRARPEGETPCVDLAQAGALVDLGERMGARFATWQGPGSLRIQQFVGFVRMGDLELEILPKLDAAPEPADVRQSLLAMLEKTEDLALQDSEAASFLESSGPFVCALAKLYLRRLLEAVRRGLRQDYVLHEDLLPYLRGKVQWPIQARLHAAQQLELACTFDERSEDTPLNRTLKAALRIAGRLLEGSRSAGTVTELRHRMDGVSDACPPAEHRARLRTNRTNRHLQPLLVLARLLLGNRNPDLGRSADGDHDTFALVWDMNVLFEEYVGRLAQGVLEPDGLDVALQHASTYLAREPATGRNAFLLRPDLLVRRQQRPWVVADTKWKCLDALKPDLGVSAADAYQMLAYAHRFETDQAVLIYPHHTAAGRPGLRKEFVVETRGPRQVRLRIVTLDLARLADVPDQLRQGLTGPSPQQVDDL